jgi:hypothetical protein
MMPLTLFDSISRVSRQKGSNVRAKSQAHPKTLQPPASLNHLSAGKDCRRDHKADRLRGLKIDIELDRKLDGEFVGFGTLQNSIADGVKQNYLAGCVGALSPSFSTSVPISRNNAWCSGP